MTNIYCIEVNIVCFLILGILLFHTLKFHYNKKELYFSIMLSAGCLMCVSDMFSGIFDGNVHSGANIILWISNMLFFISSFILAYYWIVYSFNALGKKLNNKIKIIISILISVGILICLTTPITGWIFTINSNNTYSRGSMIWIHWIVMIPSAVIPSVIAWFTKTDKRTRRAIEMFMIFPVIACVVQIFFYGLSLAQIGISVSLVLLYVMLQEDIIKEASLKTKLLEEVSNTDVLTKLNNRRAYETRLDNLKNASWVGIMFADLNGLKETNDTKGHKAGDNLICGFANYLLKFFNYEDIYRISGDEFIIIMTNSDEFSSAVKKYKKQINNMASSGISTGPGNKILNIINSAEKNMYIDKEQYYIISGKDRRRR